MAYTVQITSSAQKDIENLPDAVRPRVMAAIRGLAADPRPPGVLKMEGYKGLYRKRVGAYRIVYEIQNKELLVIVTAVDNRAKIYSALKRRLKK